MRIGRTVIAIAVALWGFCAPMKAQINTDRMMMVGRTALYFDDYVLSIQYFNQVINAKPYLAEPYFYRAVAKLSLEDFRGAEQEGTVPRISGALRGCHGRFQGGTEAGTRQ